MNRKEKEQKDVATYHLRAFDFEGKGGNLAGVIIDLDGKMTDADRQEKAKELGYSESAFILPPSDPSKADYQVLFYTKENRVPMCGHASIAAAFQLYTLGKLQPGVRRQEIINQDGTSDVKMIRIDKDGTVYTELKVAEFKQRIDRQSIAQVLNIPEDVIGTDQLQPQIVHAGFDELLIPITRQDIFQSLLYENLKEKDLLTFEKTNGVEGIDAFCLDSDDERFTAMIKITDPSNAIYPYDNATGTANGAFSCYLLKYHSITSQQATEGIWIKQIGERGTVSRVIAQADMNGQTVTKLWAGGSVDIK